MAKKLFLLGMLLLIVASAYAKYSDDFLIGSYIYGSGTSVPTVSELAPYLSDIGINCVAIHNNYSNVSILDEYGIDAWVSESNISKANNYWQVRYEAEYNNIDNENNNVYETDNVKYYYFTSDEALSNQISFEDLSYRKVTPGNSGYVIDQIWDSSWPQGRILWGQFYLPEEFPDDPPDSIIIRYALKLKTNDGFDENGNVCKIGLKAYYDYVNHSNVFIRMDSLLTPTSHNPDIGNVITKHDFMVLTADNYQTLGYARYVFEYKISKSDFLGTAVGHSVVSGNPYGRMYIKSFQPTIYYYSSTELSVDYIEVEHSKFKNIPNYVTTGLGSISNSYGNIVAIQSFDEPDAPQFLGFKAEKDLIYNAGYDFFGAINARFESRFLSRTPSIPDFHFANLFIDIAEPTTVAIDFYQQSHLAYDFVDWNSDPSEYSSGNFLPSDYGLTSIISDSDYIDRYMRPVSNIHHHIQTMESRVCDDYRAIKKAGKKLIPAVDAFSRIIVKTNGAQRYVSQSFMPSNEQIKSYIYLPLCYDADGIIEFDITNQSSHENTEKIKDRNEYDEDTLAEYKGDYVIGLVNKLSFEDHGPSGVAGMWGMPSNTLHVMEQYYAVKEANAKLKVMGSIIKNNLTWDSLKTVTLHNIPIDLQLAEGPHVTMRAFDPTGIGDDNPHPNYYEGYDGYVECSLYEAPNGYNKNYFMFVNRRGSFAKDSYLKYDKFLDERLIVPNNTNDAFVPADPQEIDISINSIDESYKLIDVYSGRIWNQEDGVFHVFIAPGDGILLQLSNFPIPQQITEHIIYGDQEGENKNTIISYPITIENGGRLTLADSSHVNFTGQASITIKSGGRLTISGNESFVGTPSKIIIEEGADVVINGGTQNFGKDCKIINNGNLTISGTLKSVGGLWEGIYCKDSANITMNDGTIDSAKVGIYLNHSTANITSSTIKNCNTGISLSDSSSVVFDKSTIRIKENSTGIYVKPNSLNTSVNVIITGDLNNPSHFIGQTCGTGIYDKVNSQYSSFQCSYANFDSLEYGIKYESIIDNSDNIEHCSFNSCINYGINLEGNGSIHQIAHSEFNSAILYINGISSLIEDDTFEAFSPACFENFSSQPFSGGINLGASFIRNCHFYNYGSIELLNSSPKICNNEFLGLRGIIIRNRSYPNLENRALNLFLSTSEHVWFIDNTSFSAGIFLKNGHNDFHKNNNGHQVYDFRFNSNFHPNDFEIVADGNWWENRDINHNQNWQDYIDVSCSNLSVQDMFVADWSEMDDYPNVLHHSPSTNRFETASEEESNENYDTAYNIYRSILTDKLESETKYWIGSADKLFNLSLLLGKDLMELKDFYQSFIDNIPDFITGDDLTMLQRAIQNYQKKCYFKDKKYQEAANIVTERIDNPISPVDSLYALMELETINYVSTLDDTTKSAGGIISEYKKILPKTLVLLNKKHEEHLAEIDRLLGINNNEENNNNIIPAKATLYNNYPNPFNPSTTISFAIPKDSKVKITIYNLKGQKVKTLTNKKYGKGKHKIVWDGTNSNSKHVASGVYFYKFDVNGKTKAVKKCLMLK